MAFAAEGIPPLGLMALAVSSVNAIPAVAAYVTCFPIKCTARAAWRVQIPSHSIRYAPKPEPSHSMITKQHLFLNSLFVQAFYFNISFLSMGMPTFCTLVLNVLISVGILQQANMRYALQHSKGQGSSSISNSTSSLNPNAGLLSSFLKAYTLQSI